MSTLNLRNPTSSPATTRNTVKPQAARSRGVRILRGFWLPAVLLLAIAAGGLTGIVVAYELNYSRAAFEVASLATYRPSVITRIYADDGETVIGEFALERRVPLRHDQIPRLVRNAILAVEDVRFEQHIGIDRIRIIGAFFKNITTGSREGGSTLTQQLALNMFLSREQTYTRKFNEWIVALQIERYYTKNQIMEMYVNHIYLGARAYGFEAAAETYFGKEAKDLTLEEAAMLAGIPRAPSQLSPTVNMENALERRNLVLELMARNGFVSQAEADAAKSRPIRLAQTAFYPMQQRSSPFDYPVEEIRRQIEEQFTTRVAFGGLTVYSTINADAQRAAVQSIREGLHNYDRTHTRWRSNYDTIAAPANGEGANGGSNNNNRTTSTQPAQPTAQQLANYIHPDWYGDDYEEDEYLRGLVMSVDAGRNEATVRFGSYTATVTARDMGWSGRQPRQEFRPGILPQFRIKTVDEANRRLTVELVQIPEIQSALLTLNARTGEIAAMVGGYDATTNKFNTATQALRQTGSAFKPFIYAAALEWGMGPNTLVSGAPIRRGNWQPHNYDGSTSHGDVPMRQALARSLNIAAVHLLDTVGIQTGSQMVRRFGITEPMAPYLPSALGATEVPLIEMVSAYSAFPNRGIRVEPHLIRRVLDRDGNVLHEWEQTTYRLTSEYVALTMADMMRAVTSSGGTAAAAGSLGVQVAGKTGTVNDHTDVWFIGFTPTWVTGVWMGHPERKQPLGNDMTGGRGALPIFINFMREFLRDKPRETFPEPPEMPEDIRELYLQRQREMREESEARSLARRSSSGDDSLPVISSEQPRLEQITLPPAPSDDSSSTRPRTTTNPAAGGTERTGGGTQTPPRTPSSTPPPPPPANRDGDGGPRRRGKKGDDEP